MSLIKEIVCLYRGHIYDAVESETCWFSATCQCCGRTVMADSLLELIPVLPSQVSRQIAAANLEFAVPTSEQPSAV
jgi:hypothetical protein